MPTLSPTKKAILVGLLLGDACLETQTNGNTWRLLIEHSEKQKLYVEHKYEIFQEFVTTPPAPRQKKSSIPGGEKTTNWGFKTTTQPFLRFYAQQFYEKTGENTFKKKVPPLIAKMLTAKALAYWYMDDGSLKSSTHKAVYLNTQGFSEKDVKVLCEVIKTKFDLECKPKKSLDKRTGSISYQIAISGGKTYDKLRQLIFDDLIESMHYKFPTPRKPKN
jgi:LAGLIDADG DNA endonuclease family